MGLNYIENSSRLFLEENMRKNIIRTVALVLIVTLLQTGTAFANVLPALNENNGKDSVITIEPRSLYLAAAISEITNEGNGVLHIYADFTSYSSVEWAKITINLERRKGATSGSWSNVETYSYEFNRSDEPDGKLIYGSADFDVSGYATGYYYRLRCEHKVKTPSGSYETKNTQTDGVLLTPYPDFRSIGK